MKVIDGGRPMERRSHPRRRTLLRGRLICGGERRSLGCAIRSLSLSGASIRLDPSIQVEEPLYLLDMTHGLAFRARTIWRKGPVIGLHFTSYFALGADTAEPGSIEALNAAVTAS